MFSNPLALAALLVGLPLYICCPQPTLALEFGFHDNPNVRQLEKDEEIGKDWTDPSPGTDWDNMEAIKDYSRPSIRIPIEESSQKECNCFYRVTAGESESEVVDDCGSPDARATVEMVQEDPTATYTPGHVIGDQVVGGSVDITPGKNEHIYEWKYFNCPVEDMTTTITFNNGKVTRARKTY